MAYNAYIYCNTGFDYINVPDSYSTLMNNFTPWKTFEDVDLIQTEYLATLRLSEIPHEVARQIDFVVIEDPSVGPEGMKRCCYTVDNFQFSSWDVIELSLVIEPISTIGGFDEATSGNRIISCNAERLSVSLDDDNSKFYTLPEPFSPSLRCVNVFGHCNTLGGTDKQLIEAVSGPPQIVEENVVYAEAKDKPTEDGFFIKSNSKMSYLCNNVGPTEVNTQSKSGDKIITSISYSRALEPASRSLHTTKLTLTNMQGTTKNVSNATLWWSPDSIYPSIKTKVKDISNTGKKENEVEVDAIMCYHDVGRDSDIINYWSVPTEYIGETQEDTFVPFGNNYGGIANISSKSNSGSIPINLQATNNKKAQYSQSATITVFCACSGESLTKNVIDVCSNSTPSATTLSANWSVSADIRPGGCPVFSFSTLNGSDILDTLPESIKGSQWRNLQMVIEGSGFYGVNDQERALNKQLKDNSDNNLLNVIGGTVGLVGNLATGNIAGSITSGVGIASSFVNFTKTQESIEEQRRILNRNAVFATTTLNVGNSNFARDLGYNCFSYCLTVYDPVDLVAYDTFLTQYGYNVGNQQISNKDLFTRPAFNYIKVHDIQIESLSSGVDLINKARHKMQEGVRLWHKKPEISDMLAGGNR